MLAACLFFDVMGPTGAGIFGSLAAAGFLYNFGQGILIMRSGCDKNIYELRAEVAKLKEMQSLLDSLEAVHEKID